MNKKIIKNKSKQVRTVITLFIITVLVGTIFTSTVSSIIHIPINDEGNDKKIDYKIFFFPYFKWWHDADETEQKLTDPSSEVYKFLTALQVFFLPWPSPSETCGTLPTCEVGNQAVMTFDNGNELTVQFTDGSNGIDGVVLDSSFDMDVASLTNYKKSQSFLKTVTVGNINNVEVIETGSGTPLYDIELPSYLEGGTTEDTEEQGTTEVDPGSGSVCGLGNTPDSSYYQNLIDTDPDTDYAGWFSEEDNPAITSISYERFCNAPQYKDISGPKIISNGKAFSGLWILYLSKATMDSFFENVTRPPEKKGNVWYIYGASKKLSDVHLYTLVLDSSFSPPDNELNMYFDYICRAFDPWPIVLPWSDGSEDDGGDTILTCDAGGPYSGKINERIAFHGSADGGVKPYSWHWQFGDGHTSDEQNPVYVYPNYGTKTATLTVTDSKGSIAYDTANVKISKDTSLTISPTEYDFGRVERGETSSPKEFTLENTGNEKVSANIGLDSNTEHFIITPKTATLSPGEKIGITVKFSPDDPHGVISKDVIQAELSAYLLGPGNAEQAASAFIHGFLPNIEMYPESVDFGESRMGVDSTVKTIELRHFIKCQGSVNIQLSVEDSDQFKIVVPENGGTWEEPGESKYLDKTSIIVDPDERYKDIYVIFSPNENALVENHGQLKAKFSGINGEKADGDFVDLYGKCTDGSVGGNSDDDPDDGDNTSFLGRFFMALEKLLRGEIKFKDFFPLIF